MGRKKKDYAYIEEVKLNHNEVAAKVDLETGEVTQFKSKFKNVLPEGMEVWLPDAIFQKVYPQSWKWLRSVTTDTEFKAAIALGQLAKAYTNSLEPLNDATILPDLTEKLGVNKNLIGITLHKLWKLGVYAKFEAYKPDKPYTKYWIFNPYLSFNGRLIQSDIAGLFQGTYVHLAYKNLPFTLILK